MMPAADIYRVKSEGWGMMRSGSHSNSCPAMEPIPGTNRLRLSNVSLDELKCFYDVFKYALRFYLDCIMP